jgi:hypothetical protein
VEEVALLDKYRGPVQPGIHFGGKSIFLPLTIFHRAGTSVDISRPGRIYPAKAPCRENSWLITGWKGCDRQEWSTSPTRADFAARIVSVGLIGVLPTAADLDGGAATEIKAPFR